MKKVAQTHIQTDERNSSLPKLWLRRCAPKRSCKQNYKCRDCGRQFVLNPQWQVLSEEQQGLIERLLLERISLAGIARVLQLSEDCVQRYVNRLPFLNSTTAGFVVCRGASNLVW